MTARSNVHRIYPTDPALVVDALGDARAKLAALKADIDDLEEAVESFGLSEIDGYRYRVTISYFERASIAWKKIAMRFKPSRQLIAANTNKVPVKRINVSALKKEV